MKQFLKQPKTQYNRGQAMLFTMICVVLLSTLVTYGISGPVVRDYRVAAEGIKGRKSYFLSESSIEDVYYRVKSNISVASSETLYSGSDYTTVTVTDLSSTQKQVTSVSNVSGRQRTTTALFERTGGGTSFTTAVQAGRGGITLSGSSRVNGSAYVNGNIVGTGQTPITGSATAAATEALSTNQSNGVSGTPANTLVFGQTSAAQDAAQSFQVSSEVPLNKIQVYVKKTGSPSNATVRIVADNAGVPGTVYLAQGTLTASTVTTSYNWVDVTFSTNPTLQTGTTYWLVLDATASSTKYYTLGANNNGYATGVSKSGTYSGTWNNPSPSTIDFYFKVFLGGLSSSITGVSQWNQIPVGTNSSHSAYADTLTSVTSPGTLYCQTGSQNNKACNTSLPSPQVLPWPVADATIAAWQAEAVAGGTTTGNVNAGDGWQTASLGPRKIVGDLTVTGSATLNVTGTLWITGNLTVDGAGIMRLASSYGSSSGAIVVSGRITIGGSSPVQGSGSANSYLTLVSLSDCPTSSSCGGANAISVSGAATSIVLIAQDGTIAISGSGSAKQATGYKVTLDGSTSITYESGLALMSFSGGSSGSWGITSWKETE